MKHVVWLGVGLVLLLASLSGCGHDGEEVTNDITVTLTTAGGATNVPSGGSLVIKANVTNATNDDVTWSLSGPNCPNDCGTIVPSSTDTATYTAPDDVTAEFTVTVAATSDEDTTKSGSVELTIESRICPAMTSLLSGQYAFLLQGFDPGNGIGVAAVGSFTADGCGNVTGGMSDFYFGPTVAGTTPSLNGSYTVDPDHRGTLSITLGTSIKTFAIAVGETSGGVASNGAMTEEEPGATEITALSGSMWLQDPTAFAQDEISGPYAFVFNGWNASSSYGTREAMGGTLLADGHGGFDGGPLDDKVVGIAPPVSTASWTGSYGVPSSEGRSVLSASALTGANGTAVMYVVRATQLIVMISDTSSTGRVFSGRMLSQTGSFDLGSLDGRLVAYQTANYNQVGYETLTTAVLTFAAADGLGSLSVVSLDQNYGGNRGTGTDEYVYTVDANGQATLTSGSIVGGKWYLTGANSGLMLGFDFGVSVGAIMPQSGGPFSIASIRGSYVASQAPGGSVYSTNSSGVATSAGDGALETVMDENTAGAFVPDQMDSSTLTVAADGRATDTNDDVIYVVSSSTFLRLQMNTDYPVIQIFERLGE